MQTSNNQAPRPKEAGIGLMEVIVGSLCALIVIFVLLQVGRIMYAKVKLRWASDAHELGRMRIFRPGAYGTLLHTVEARVLATLRRLRARGDAA